MKSMHYSVQDLVEELKRSEQRRRAGRRILRVMRQLAEARGEKELAQLALGAERALKG